jgi:hypothetical protein
MVTKPLRDGDDWLLRGGHLDLEHFGKGKSRGFPENTSGGPTYPTRTSAQLTALATTIRDVIQARILVLTEINGRNDEEEEPTSEELEDLVGRLGPAFRYVSRAAEAPRGLRYSTTPDSLG